MADIDVSKLSITQFDKITCFNNANELEFVMDEIQEGAINQTQDKSDITGRGGRKIGSLKKNKAVTITATNGVLVGGALAAQTGSDVEQGSFKVRMTEVVAVNDNKATLTGTPVGTTGAEIGYAYITNPSGSLGKQYEQAADAQTEGKFSFTGKDLTFHDGDIENGTEVTVFYDAEVTAAQITNQSDVYSKVLKMFIDVTCQDTCDNMYHGQFIINRADFSGEFELSVGNDPMVHAIEAESLAGGCNKDGSLWKFIIYK